MTADETEDWTLATVTYNNSAELDEWWSGNDLQGARWIVVDNNSSDGSADIASALGADVIRLSENVGFSKANNVALTRAQSKYIAFVNPDVRVKASTLEEIGNVIREKHAVVCPQLINPDGTTQPNGRGLPFLVDKMAHRGVNLPGSSLTDYLPDTSSGPTYVAWAMGAAVCAEVQWLRSLGGWDERYFLYYEDHAFGLRAWEHGRPVILLPSVQWTHSWKRATNRAKLMPWLREFASAGRFYSQYPGLLIPPASGRRRQWKGQRYSFGAPIVTEASNESR